MYCVRTARLLYPPLELVRAKGLTHGSADWSSATRPSEGQRSILSNLSADLNDPLVLSLWKFWIDSLYLAAKPKYSMPMPTLCLDSKYRSCIPVSRVKLWMLTWPFFL